MRPADCAGIVAATTGATFGVVTVKVLLVDVPATSVAVTVIVQLPLGCGVPLSVRVLALKLIHDGMPLTV